MRHQGPVRDHHLGDPRGWLGAELPEPVTGMHMSTANAGKVGRHGLRQPWLLLYNCQGMGLGNSLNLLSDEIDVEYFDPASFRKKGKSILTRLQGFDRVLVAPQ